MIRLALSAALLAASLLPATAAIVTLDFNDQTCTDPAADFQRTVGTIIYEDPNLGSYGDCGPEIRIGDDGLADQAAISTAPGTRFDLLRFDLIATSDVRSLPYDPRADPAKIEDRLFNNARLIVPDFPIFELTGFRNGIEVARLTLPAFSGAVTPDATFTGLDTILFRQTAYGNGTFMDEDGEYVYGCGSGGNSCGSITYDNVRLDVLRNTIDPAPVPLPATGGLTVAALTMAGIIARRRRRG